MIRIENLCSGYGSRQVLFDICADIERGSLISVIGPNGCGKSTLLRSIVGILPSRSGEVEIDGTSLSTLGRVEIAKRVAYLAQGKSAPDMTVEQMVLHGRFAHLSYPRIYGETDRKIAAEAMRRVGVLDLADRPVSSLSGGMRQNAYIAMALAQDTDYILLDEPTTYLDISHQIELMNTLCALAEGGKGILAVMHDIPLALRYSDKVIVVDDGRVVAVDTPDQIYRSGIIDATFGVSLMRTADSNGFYYSYKK